MIERRPSGEVWKSMDLPENASRKDIDAAFGDLILQCRGDGGVKLLAQRIHYEPDGTHRLLVRMGKSRRVPADG